MNIDDIVKKALFYGAFKTKKELAKWLDIDASAITQWKRAGNIPKRHLNKIEKLIKKEEITEPTNETYQVKKLTCKASAGAGNDITDIDLFDSGEALHFDTAFFKVPPNKTVRAIQVDGYSMIPMLFPDSWVLFETGDRWVGDGLYVLNFRGELMVKLLQLEPNGTLHIISTNKDYQSWETNPKEDQSLYYIIGKVLRSVI